MKMDIGGELHEALDKLGINFYEHDDIERVLLRMAHIIYDLKEGVKNEKMD